MEGVEVSVWMAAGIFAVGVVGIVCAILAAKAAKNEVESLTQARGLLENDEARRDLYGSSPPGPVISRYGLQDDSHVGDQFNAVWSGWRNQRMPTPGELYSLVVRRERSRTTARLAGGIAATLLILGIAGTLWAIHPILGDFALPIMADGTRREAAEGAGRVMTMIHQLSNAFLPSLFALGMTLAVVASRGVYVHHANRLGQRIDRFLTEDLLPAFHVPTLGQELAAVATQLTLMTAMMESRDKSFADAVGTMKRIIAGIEKDAEALGSAAKVLASSGTKLEKAAGKLSGQTVSLGADLEKHFGADSVLVQSLATIGGVVDEARKGSGEMTHAAKSLGTTASEVSAELRKSGGDVKSAVDSLPLTVKFAFKEGITSATKELRAAAAEVKIVGNQVTGQIDKAGLDLEPRLKKAVGEADATFNKLGSQLLAAVAALEKSIEARRSGDGQDFAEIRHKTAALGNQLTAQAAKLDGLAHALDGIAKKRGILDKLRGEKRPERADDV